MRATEERETPKTHEKDTYFLIGHNGRSGDRKGRDGTDLLRGLQPLF
jgi:hypothetical protein